MECIRRGCTYPEQRVGVNHATSRETLTLCFSKAMSSMSNLSVEISMDCMVVEIERPWLRAELFSDAEIDSGP